MWCYDMLQSVSLFESPNSLCINENSIKWYCNYVTGNVIAIASVIKYRKWFIRGKWIDYTNWTGIPNSKKKHEQLATLPNWSLHANKSRLLCTEH